jgi:hypothetical protein
MDAHAAEAALAPTLHPLEVFERVAAAMEALGCSGYKPSHVGRAATGQRGGAPALLLVGRLGRNNASPARPCTSRFFVCPAPVPPLPS